MFNNTKTYNSQIIYTANDTAKAKPTLCKLSKDNYADFIDQHKTTIRGMFGVLGEAIGGRMPTELRTLRNILLDFPDFTESRRNFVPSFITLNEFSGQAQLAEMMEMLCVITRCPNGTLERPMLENDEFVSPNAVVSWFRVKPKLRDIEAIAEREDMNQLVLKTLLSEAVAENRRQINICDEYISGMTKLVAYILDNTTPECRHILDICPIFNQLVMNRDLLACLFYLKQRFSELPGDQLAKKRELVHALEKMSMSGKHLSEIDEFNSEFNKLSRKIMQRGGELSGEAEALVYLMAVQGHDKLTETMRLLRYQNNFSSAIEVQNALMRYLAQNQDLLKRKKENVALVGALKKQKVAHDTGDNSKNKTPKYESIGSKYQLCKGFAAGNCKFGDKCKFVHVLAEQIPDDMNLYCARMALRGKCKFGDSCYFVDKHEVSKGKHTELRGKR